MTQQEELKNAVNYEETRTWDEAVYPEYYRLRATANDSQSGSLPEDACKGEQAKKSTITWTSNNTLCLK
jgi:hypothetical protein